jgi:hypothetical protein
VKLLRVAGVSVGTTTSGGLFVVADGCGLGLGVLRGVLGVTVVGGVDFVGVGIFGGTGVDLEGGVTVIAGDTIPIVRLVAHNMAITPGLMLLGFMISTVPLD